MCEILLTVKCKDIYHILDISYLPSPKYLLLEINLK